MSQALEDIRKKIDSIDNQVHDLLMERAALVFDIAAEKAKNKMQVVQPAREAMMLRRLLGRHQGPLPEPTIVQIWRELVGAVSLLQTGLSVIVTTKSDGTSPFWDMARNYFGSVLPMKKANSPLIAIASVRDNESYFAVMPWPEDGDTNPWWTYLMGQENDPMRIALCLPYGSENENMQGQTRALVVSKIDFKSSGDDRSFVALELTSDVSRGKIVDVLKKIDLEVLSLHTKASPNSSLHLLELKSFIASDDVESLKKIQDAFDSNCLRCVSMGGYPAPPVFKKKTQSATAAPKAESKIATQK